MKTEDSLSAPPTRFQERLDSFTYQKKTPQRRRRLLQELAEYAVHFDDWLSIFYCTVKNSALEKKALGKLRKLPATKNQLFEAIEFAPVESELRKVIEWRLATLGITNLNGHEKPFVIKIPSAVQTVKRPKE